MSWLNSFWGLETILFSVIALVLLSIAIWPHDDD